MSKSDSPAVIETNTNTAASGAKVDADVMFVDRSGKPVKAKITRVEDPKASLVAIRGTETDLIVVGVPFDPTGKKLESWSLAPAQ